MASTSVYIVGNIHRLVLINLRPAHFSSCDQEHVLVVEVEELSERNDMLNNIILKTLM